MLSNISEQRDIKLSASNLMAATDKKLCFVVLGHEIKKKTFELSFSGKERCRALHNQIQNLEAENYFILFMGSGRLQGKCKLSISECMLNYFSKQYFMPKNYLIDKTSLDTVGDAIFSFYTLSLIQYKSDVKIVTSDWHLQRVKDIFKKIYGERYNNISFIITDELKNLSKDEKISIEKKENNSMLIFNKMLKKANYTKGIKHSLLLSNHNLYHK